MIRVGLDVGWARALGHINGMRLEGLKRCVCVDKYMMEFGGE